VGPEDVRLEEPAAAASPAADLAESAAENGSPEVGAAQVPVAGRQSEIGSLREAVERLGVQVAQGHARAAARERIIDRLHDEVELLRAGQARVLLRPAVSDLRRLHGDLLAQARSAPDGMTRAQVAALLESFADSAELALERCGVTVVRPAAGMACDPRLHQAVEAMPTSSPELDKTIVRVVSDGYTELDTGRTLAPARVVIYSLAPGEEGSS